METVIAKAKAACRNSGHQVQDNFRDVSKVSAQRGSRPQDVQMTRFGMYLLAMNGDPDKPEIAAAQRYFAIQTYRAETQLPPPRENVPLLPRYWSERLDRTIVAHRRHIIQNFPSGCWSIYTATVTETLILEDEFLRHCLPLKRSDLPDGSIGKRWVNHREGAPWAGRVRTAPLVMPYIIVQGESLVVYPNVYEVSEVAYFQRWLFSLYLPECLPQYMGNKFPCKTYGLAPLSASDHTCLEITGMHACLPHDVRRRLRAANGFIAYNPDQLEGPTQRGLFD
jgi:hypothetical protein